MDRLTAHVMSYGSPTGTSESAPGRLMGFPDGGSLSFAFCLQPELAKVRPARAARARIVDVLRIVSDLGRRSIAILGRKNWAAAA